MPKPDGSTAPPTTSGQGPGPIAARLADASPAGVASAGAEPGDRAPADEPPRAVLHAASPGGADTPKRAAHDRNWQQADQHPNLGADLQAVIGRQLRAVYHEVLDEPVPARFVRLLAELATKTADRA